MAASYPSATKSFSTKVDGAGNTIAADHVNAIQDEVVAIENGLRTGLEHDLKFTDATYDIGKPAATRPRDVILSRNLVVGGTATVTGIAAFTAAPTVAAGIQFPATQAASADANNLDDYEEGTWTPVIGGSGGTAGQTYTTQVGYYQKIGKRVTLDFNVVLSAAGTITGTPQIQGLPFTSITASGYKAIGSLGWTAMLTTTWSTMRCAIASNVAVLTIEGNLAASVSSATAPANSDIGDTTQFRGTISYMTAA